MTEWSWRYDRRAGLMDGNDGVTLLWGIGALVLVGSSLLAYRLPVGRTIKYAAAWLGIFALVYGLVLFRHDFAAVWTRAKADLGFGHEAVVRGEQTVIRQADDGHFWVTADIEGNSVEFLIDTGATTTAISPETASALGLAVDRSGVPMTVSTANGEIEAWPSTVTNIKVGNIVMDELDVQVSDVPDTVNLLGMNWLSAVGRWRVEGREMVLEP